MYNVFSFANEVVEEIRSMFPEREVEIREVVKNNDLKLCGCTIREPNSNIGPTIYLDNYFKSQISVEETVQEVLSLYEHIKVPSINFDMLFNWDFVKTKIKPRVFSKEMNKERMQDYTYMVYGDLVIFFVIEIPELSNEAEFTIKKDLFNCYGVSLEELFAQSMSNLEHDEVRIFSLNTVLFDVEEQEDDWIFVSVTKTQLYGANLILRKNLLRRFSMEHENTNLIIIPSSVHELLLICEDLIPGVVDFNEIDFNEMVKCVNNEAISAQEVLSEHTYYYDYQTNKIYLEKDGEEMVVSAY